MEKDPGLEYAYCWVFSEAWIPKWSSGYIFPLHLA